MGRAPADAAECLCFGAASDTCECLWYMRTPGYFGCMRELPAVKGFIYCLLCGIAGLPVTTEQRLAPASTILYLCRPLCLYRYLYLRRVCVPFLCVPVCRVLCVCAVCDAHVLRAYERCMCACMWCVRGRVWALARAYVRVHALAREC